MLSTLRTAISKNCHQCFNQKFQRAWALAKFPLAATTFTSAAFASYTFYECNFDLKVTKSHLLQKTRQFLYFVLYAPHTKKETYTEPIFTTHLPIFLYETLTFFFLSLDAVKCNGVRISDILFLLEKAGVSLDHCTVMKFIKKGNGRRFEEKKFSGCSLQEVQELFGELYHLSQTSESDSTLLPKNFSKQLNEAIVSEIKSLKLS